MTALEKFDFQRAYLTKLKRRPSSKRLQIFKMIGDSRSPCQCTSYSNTVLILVAVLDIHHTAQKKNKSVMENFIFCAVLFQFPLLIKA